MRAVVCKDWSGPAGLVATDVPEPTPGPGQVKIALGASGVNFADILVVSGLYQVKPDLPFIPGFEGAGTVTEVGPGVDSASVGDRVVLFAGIGCFAEKVVADVSVTAPAPDNLTDAEAATFMTAYGTSYHALVDRAAVSEGETVVVLGAAGGVGIAAVEIAKLLGCRVAGAVSSERKAEFVLERGADVAIRYDREDLRTAIRDFTDGEGADVVYDPVGGSATETCFRSLRWNGRLLVVGFAAGKIPSLPLNLALLKSASAVGVFWGDFVVRYPVENRANLVRLKEWCEQGLIHPHVDRVFSFEQAPSAMDYVAERQVLGRVCLVP
ncbi:MAG: NADPH:quinone oxidoreductase family protein [bacterium]|nr:NADPH:quinone oxidoreductase family protein [bacterium]